MLELLFHKMLLPRLRAAWRGFLDSLFNPYRPELYYMRGPGPKWRAKNLVPVKVKVSRS